jgi:hypothetical protein
MTPRRIPIRPSPVPTRARKPDWNDGATLHHAPPSNAEQPRTPAPPATERPPVEVPDDAPLSSPPQDPKTIPTASLAKRAVAIRSPSPCEAAGYRFIIPFDKGRRGKTRAPSRAARPATGLEPAENRADGHLLEAVIVLCLRIRSTMLPQGGPRVVLVRFRPRTAHIPRR